MANEKQYTINFQVDGLDESVNSVEDFTEAMNDAGKATEKAGEEATIFDGIKDKFNDLKKGLRTVTNSFKGLKGAIAATGIGALIIAIGSLVAYFKSSEEGSRKLAIATEALSLIFGKLTEFAGKVGEGLVNTFSNPKQALLDFGNLLKSQIVNRVQGMLELLPALGKAIGLAFKGKFKEASTTAGNALGKVLLGVDDVVGKVTEVGTKAVEAFGNLKKEVLDAVEVATKLVDAQRALRDQQQKLIVENAELNQELEKQRKIAEDTTLSYEERAAALEKVGETQIKLAKNVADQAKAEEDLLKLQIENASTYEEREELETQLAEATAARIDAQTALNTVEQEAAKLGRELELEELDRKRSIRDMIQELNQEELDDAFELARQELAIAEQQAMEELDLLKATDEEKTKAAEGFAKKRKQIAKEEALFREQLEKQVQEANLSVLSGALGAIGSLLGENSKAAKAFAVAQTTVDTYMAAQKAYASQLIPGDPTSPVRATIAAGVAIASGLANVKAILKTNPDGASGTPSRPSVPTFNPTTAINIPGAANNVVTPEAQSVVKAYVVSSDMTSQQEADKKINDLATL